MGPEEMGSSLNRLVVTDRAGDVFENNNVWGKLPRDLQLKLLSGLPLKELARLRLVCKYFHSLLSSDPCLSTFYHPPQTKFFLHSLVLPQTNFLLHSLVRRRRHFVTSVARSLYFLHDETRGTSRWMPPLCCPPLLSLVASNDGFLCFEGHREPNIPTIFIHNPTTPNLWNILTVPESGPIVFQNCFIGIAFDRNLGACKIVLAGPISKKMTRTLIFDAKNDTWRKLQDLDDVFVPRMKEPFVFNGLFYWLAWSRGQKSEMVVSFDVENEKWEEPLVLDDRRSTPLCMAELEKQACVISVNKKNPEELELRKLEVSSTNGLKPLRRHFKWVKTFWAPFQMVSSNNISAFGGGDVMCIGSNGRFWVYHIKDKVWSYVGLFHKDVFKWRNVATHKCTFYNPTFLKFHGDQLLQGIGKVYMNEVLHFTRAWLGI